MTVSYSYVPIATNIATAVNALTVFKSADTTIASGSLTVKDLGGYLEMVEDRDCPLLQPDLDVSQFVSGSPDTPESFGVGGTAVYQTAYTLNWMYFHCEIGAYRSAPNLIRQQVFQNAALIQAAFLAVDTSIITGKEVRFIPNISVIPALIQQSGNNINDMYGCPISATVVEWQNL